MPTSQDYLPTLPSLAQTNRAGPSVPLIDTPHQPFWNWQAANGGSYSEFIVWDYLTQQRNLRPNRDFHYRFAPPGGPAGFALDFYFPLKHEAWVVEGIRYTGLNSQDIIGKRMSRGAGLKVVTLWEDDLFSGAVSKVLDLAYFNGQENTVRQSRG